MDENCITSDELKRLYDEIKNKDIKCRNDYISYLRLVGMKPREIAKDLGLNVYSVYKTIELNKRHIVYGC